MQLHFENNIFVVSCSPCVHHFAFNHLETLVWFWFLQSSSLVVTKKRVGAAHTM